ncbi:unnamed protein product [Menidia menidia]|uniref:(Atlantic silverside) hypothetical protein n=1 Tax=Menidia menidia TaxID=238744 RepID=A0A8S4BHJ2_9TELE|nr:unnamed protein product [Menidia menidia]
MQRNRQERRLRRQAELLALQERTRPPPPPPPPGGPPPPPPPARPQTLFVALFFNLVAGDGFCALCSRLMALQVEPGRGGHSVSTATSTHRGRSPPVPSVTHRVQSQQDSTTPAPPVLDFFPYVRTDEVFHLDPLEPAHTPPPPDPSVGLQESEDSEERTRARVASSPPPPPRGPAAPPAAPPRDRLLRPERQTQRQQEILRGLAELRQGLLQKQRELETDLNPLLNRHDNKQRPPTATNRT